MSAMKIKMPVLEKIKKLLGLEKMAKE